jgi:hypothetical protein
LLCATATVEAQSTTFSFTLDEPCKTSAGVFASDGSLVRTLWSKTRYYAPGTYSEVWDGLDDHTNAVSAGVYEIVVLQHNTEYLWDGAIGNTSDELSGPTVHKGFYPMRGMSIDGTNGYYVSGYNEGGYDFRNFFTTDPQRVIMSWGADGQPANIYDPTWNWTTTDGKWVYFACSAATNPTNTDSDDYPGFIVASLVGDSAPAYSAYFTQGVPIVNGADTNTVYPNGIYVGTQAGLTGLAVQQNGPFLAASVVPDNQVYLLGKYSGAPAAQFYVNSPRRLSFSPDGNIWVISGNNVVCYSNLTVSGSEPTNGLVAWYPLAGDVNDYSGNGNNGAAEGDPSYTTGESGAADSAISLDGFNQYISLGHPSVYDFGTNDFTIQVWFETDSTSSPQQLLACDDISGRQFIFDINDLSEGTLSAYLFSSDTNYLGYGSGNILLPNTWYMATLVKSGNVPGALALYLDDSLVASFAAFANDFPLTVQATASEVDIGRRTYSGYEDFFSGSISGVRVYNRALSGNEVVALYASGLNVPVSSYSPVVTLSNFSEPLDVAVCPTNSDLVLVADGGSKEQIEAFNSAGTPLWTYGQPGGYQANGVAVATNKFWFYDGETDGTFLCFAPDGSFWVGDGGNFRSMHFSATCDYLEQIMYQPHSYVAAVDQNNPSRVLNQFLEFDVDYSKPLAQAWTLVNNWLVGVPAGNISWNAGLYEVTTFPNGRVYALIDDDTYEFARSELCELITNQLRLTGLYPGWSANRGWISLGADGSARNCTIGAPTWYEATLSGFDESNNPEWNPLTLIATAPAGSYDPVPRGESFGNIRTTISTNNVLISFDQSLNDGFHLGGIRVGGNSWLWEASPPVEWFNGFGGYEIDNSVVYGGNTLQAVGRNVIYGYHGEFYYGQGQAAQNMHFYDDGLFVGQFGESDVGHFIGEGALPGYAGNAQCPSLIKTSSGDYYAWVNDEGDHGPQRWHFVNARNIREQSNSVTLGGTTTLTSPPCGFPTGVNGKNGNQSGELSWLPVPGASSYNVRYSLMNGGPYCSVAGSTTNLDYVVGGLNNGQTYYFAVTAIQAGTEGIPSEQVPINPFDTSQTVLCTGSMTEGGLYTPVIDVNSSAPGSGQPSYVGAEHLTGTLDLRELDYYGYGNLQNETVGTEGYTLYDWQGPGSNLTNVYGPFTVTPGSGWTDVYYLDRQYRVDNVLGLTDGWTANPVGSVNIGVSDTNFHYLTVVSPDVANWERIFTMKLTSTNGTSAVYSINEGYGFSHVFQFLFRGNVTLWADATGGYEGNVQGLFLDNAAVTYLPASTSPITTTNTLPVLTGAMFLGDGAFQFSFSNSLQATSYTVLSSTNLSLPLSNWTVLGAPSNIAPGLLQFTAQTGTNSTQCYYTVRSP